MKTYNVKQISDMLNTSQETVRRWIRSGKLKSVQVSKKDGNIITETDFEKFLNSTPKYLPKFNFNTNADSAMLNSALLIGNMVVGAIYSQTKKNASDVGVLPDDLKSFMGNYIQCLENEIMQKKQLIAQTEKEIENIQNQIRQYDELLNKKQEE